MEQAGNILDIVILDACRNNPLPAGTRSGTKGLASMVAPPHAAVAFATRAGTVAYDGQGARNSPFAAALAYYLQQSGLEMKALFDAVTERVYDLTKNESVPQIPVLTYTLAPTFYFRPAAQARQPAPLTVFRDCTDCPELVRIPAGNFLMGSPVPAADKSREGPQHRVDVAAFALGKYDVTFEQMDACVAAKGCSNKPGDFGWGRGRRPVVDVSWDDAQEYVRWLSRKTGHTYRLPTEAEWEYAARAGTTTAYYWGDAFAGGQCAGCGNGGKTAPVGSFPPNPWGLFDMAGNVYQWTQDRWHPDYTGAPADGSAWETGERPYRVVRGGNWDYSPKRPGRLRTAHRAESTVTGQCLSDQWSEICGVHDRVGFRVASSWVSAGGGNLHSRQ
jgi:formylglycine-generating enzyme required for sulfatase activity